MSETKHASWLAGEGYRQKISLYDACVTDLINAYFQCARQLAFLEGKYTGCGPTLELLVERALSRQKASPSPIATSRAVDDAVAGTPMFSNRVKFKGENKTIRCKRPLHDSTEENFGNSSHRPEFNYVTRERLEPAIEVEEQCKVLESLESDVHDTKWALRRIPTVNRVECNHWASGKKCSSKLRGGDVSPCFWSDCQLSSWKKEKYCYFCNTDVRHTWKITKTILHPPEDVPCVWPIARGTKLQVKEACKLIRAGYDIGIPLEFFLEKELAKDTSETNKEVKQFPYRRGISKAAFGQITAALDMHAEVVGSHIHIEGVKETFSINPLTNGSQETPLIEVTVQKNPMCSCVEFRDRVAKKRPYLACKHIYFVFLMILGQDVNNNMHIHQVCIPERIVKDMLTKSIRSHPQQL